MRGALIFLTGITSILASCSEAPSKPIKPDFIVRLVGNECHIVFADQSFPLDTANEALLSKLRGLYPKDSEIHVRGYGDTPYRCIGPAISLAQSAGHVRVGYISDPSTDPLAQEK